MLQLVFAYIFLALEKDSGLYKVIDLIALPKTTTGTAFKLRASTEIIGTPTDGKATSHRLQKDANANIEA